ncbi:MAG: ribonuclease J [Magnetospiraceae bacterium]
MTAHDNVAPDGPELLYVPLGGTGEIGMNLGLYGYGSADGHRWLMVDCGITFGDDTTPGVEIILPDPSFIAERADRLEGLLLTHGHEDHLGAIPYLWRRFRCPIYATPFTAGLLRRKLEDAKLANEVPLHVIDLKSRLKIGPFDLQMITVTHSIPEANSVVIRTPVGTAVHSGDWKFDPDPVIGEVSDLEALAKVGNEGVHAFICDSTNVLNEKRSGSEGALLETLTNVISRHKKKVAVACFATNVARLNTIAKAARANGREVALFGRSLWRLLAVAKENGYVAGLPNFIKESEAGYIPDEKLLVVCTGSQGEPRAALSRIARGEHPHLSLGRGDAVIFSSRVIPGNERAIGRLQNQLVEKSVSLITWKDDFIHVSGHPSAPEMREMYGLLRPRIAVPQHGESRHLLAHAALATEMGAEQVVVIGDGDILRLAPGPAEVVDSAPVGRLTLEGNRIAALDSEIHMGRKRALYNGHVVMTVVVDKNGDILGTPQMTTQGLLDEEIADDAEIAAQVLDAVSHAADKLKRAERRDDAILAEALRIAVRRAFRTSLDKRPVTKIHLVRV